MSMYVPKCSSKHHRLGVSTATPSNIIQNTIIIQYPHKTPRKSRYQQCNLSAATVALMTGVQHQYCPRSPHEVQVPHKPPDFSHPISSATAHSSPRNCDLPPLHPLHTRVLRKPNGRGRRRRRMLHGKLPVYRATRLRLCSRQRGAQVMAEGSGRDNGKALTRWEVHLGERGKL